MNIHHPQARHDALPQAQTPTHPAHTVLRKARLALTLAAIGALAACASTPPPTTEMALARAAVDSAVNAGGPQFAPAETALARDKLTRAMAAMSAKDNAQARTLAEQVQVDARLAEARAEAEKARRSAAAVQDANRALREESARQPR